MRDERLPQLGAILNGTAVADSLAAACLDRTKGWKIEECNAGHVRYKPGKNCLVRYDAVLVRGEETKRQMWYGLAYEPGGSESRFEKALKGSAPRSAEVGPGIAHLDGLGMVVWAFPNDRKLRGLEIMTDSALLWEEVFADSGEAAGSTQIVRYIPEHGCTAKLTVRSGRRYFAKLTTAGDAETSRLHSRALGREAWTTAQFGIRVQAEVPGTPANGMDDLAECARALARFHQQDMPNLAPAKDADGAMAIERARILLSRYESADWLLDQVVSRRCEPVASATLHGDLHVKNFLVSGGSAELIDLDTVHAGDPLADIASFAASLYHRALLAGEGIETVDSAVEEFLQVYQSCVPWRFEARDVATQVARALIAERACRSITRCKGDVVDALLAAARRMLYANAITAGVPSSARDWMEHFCAKARIRRGALIDVDYRTYRKAGSLAKSSATVVWRDAAGIHAERIGPEPRRWEIAAEVEQIRECLPVERATQVEMDVLNVRPGNRITARYRVATASGGNVVIYGKTYEDSRGSEIAGRLARLEQAGFFMPRPLGYSEPIRTVWQEAFPGVPLLERLSGADEAALLGEAAARVAFLHESGLDCPARLTVGEQLVDLEKKLAKLGTVVPEHASRFGRITARLRERMRGLAPVTACVVHGDLHIGQFMVSVGRVALFDFDETSVGDPCEDFAAFTANLHAHGYPAGRVQQISETLLNAYAECRGGFQMPQDRLRWHTAVHLLTRAYRALIQLRPGLDQIVERTLALAEQCI